MKKIGFRKRCLAIVLAVMMMTLGMPIVANAVSSTVIPLYAGQHIDVGAVTIINSSINELTVKFETTGGWVLTETHLYVDLEEPDKSAPGQFPYKHSLGSGVTSDVFTIAIEPGETYYIAGHAVVQLLTGTGTKEETAWAQAPTPSAISWGTGWGSYFEYETDKTEPSIDIEKLVSVDGGVTWHDADETTGPEATYPGKVQFKVIVTNTGNVALEDITVTDTDFNFEGIKVELEPGEYDESNIKEVDAVVGQHGNTATVEGYYGETKVVDSDMAHYIAKEIVVTEDDPSIDIEKLVSVDGGVTWHDADEAKGPKAEYQGKVQFKVIVTNTGNVTIEDITVTDTDFTFEGVLTELAAGETNESDIKEVNAVVGQHSNTAIVEGYYEETKVSDSDMAHYFVTQPEDPNDDDEDEGDKDDEDNEDENENEDDEEVVKIDDPNVPLDDELLPVPDTPEAPEEVIENQEVPQSLPDTGSILNTTIVFILGLILLLAGVFLDKRMIKS